MSLLLPARRAELLAAGLPATALDNDVRARRTAPIFRGVHVGTELLGPASRRRAALLTQGPSAVLSHRSAAVVRGFRWLPAAWSEADATVHVTVPPADKHRARAGLAVHRSALDPTDIAVVDGEPCTSAARTLVDLHAQLDRLAGQRGVRSARARVDEARYGVDSSQETRCV